MILEHKGEYKMWNEINDDHDLSDFLEMHYGFHDSCIKEFKYISGAYVDENYMYPINDLRILRIIFQGLFKKSSVIEMEFIGLKYIKIYPNDPNYTCEILDATMLLKEDCIFWCDCGSLSEDDLVNYKGTIICASRVRWRAADEYIGQKEIYLAISNVN
jgi:hypothetical protein